MSTESLPPTSASVARVAMMDAAEVKMEPKSTHPGKHAFRAVKVTAADFNGKDFDGAPLVGVFNGIDDVHALFPTLLSDKTLVEARGQTDYAWFGIKDDYNNVHWAGPGDYIVAMTPNKLIVVPGAFFDHFMAHVP